MKTSFLNRSILIMHIKHKTHEAEHTKD